METGDFYMCDYIVSFLSSAGSSILGAVVGGFIGAWSGKENVEKAHQLAVDERILRLREQIKYCVELYNCHLNVFSETDRTQDDIDASIWKPGIFIFATDYKSDLLYADLTEAEKLKVVSWFYQWEIINREMSNYLSSIKSTEIASVTILNKKCMKQNEVLKKLLPDIKDIIHKLENQCRY